ncbi:MAG: DUF4263 domain-containing protein [Bacteroidales bacterium]|nr:DUF4263 domain-containing protein [Bacteroidales bacterium]
MAQNKKQQPREEKVQSLKIKDVYFYIDEENGINVKSKEVYKNGKKVIHYPFRTDDGSQKYTKVRKIIFEDLPKNLPRGFNKSYYKGYGFTKIYSSLLYAFENKFDVREIIVSKNKANEIKGKQIIINAAFLDRIYPQIDTLFKRQRIDKNRLLDDILNSIFPYSFEKSEKKYIPDSLYLFIRRNISNISDLSQRDVKSLFNIASNISLDDFFVNKVNVLKTRDKIEEYYIEEVLQEFEKLFEQKTETEQLEEKWQSFFKEHSWIFAQLFSFPVLIYSDKAYVGGKDIHDKGGKIADFVYKNKLTNNIAFIEIKTHKSKLLKKSSYRGNDVFNPDKDLGGAISQVLDQRDNMQKEFYRFRARSKEVFETYNSKCIVVVGMIADLSDEQKKSFELIRSNSKDVEIITFDEIYQKIKGLETLLFRQNKTK